MGAVFASGLSQYLRASGNNVITNYPFTVGMWVYPTASAVVGGNAFWSAGVNTLICQTLALGQTSGEQWMLYQIDATSSTAAVAGTVVANNWHYLLGRFTTSGNRRLSVLNSDGTISHAQDTTASSLTVAQVALGAKFQSTVSGYATGGIGEYWCACGDILASGNIATPDDVVRAVAYEGPFAFPSIQERLVDYHSLYNNLTFSRTVQRSHPFDQDFMYRGRGRNGVVILNTGWVNVATVMIGPHPPIRYHGRDNARMKSPYNLAPIFAGMHPFDAGAGASGASFSWGAVWRNRLMMVGHGR